MKLVIAVLAAACLGLGCLAAYQVLVIEDRIDRLERSGAGGAVAVVPASFGGRAGSEAALARLAGRVARLEARIRAPARGSGGAGGAGIRAELATHAEELAALREELSRLAERGGNRPGPRPGGRRGQVSEAFQRMAEARSLFRAKDEELTAEERARRQELIDTFRKRRAQESERRIDRTIDALDRSLEAKLTDQQRLEIRQLLEDERKAMEELRGGELSQEERAARTKALREQIDADAQRILSAEQYDSWVTFRSRSWRAGPSRRGFFRRPGGGRR